MTQEPEITKEYLDSPGNVIWTAIINAEGDLTFKAILARKLNITFDQLNKLIYNHTPISVEIAYQLEKLIKVNARELLIMQVDYYLNAIKRKNDQ